MLEAFPPGGRDRRLVSAILILAAIVLTYLAISLTADGVFYFGDTLLTFFLAWLLAFIISPIVTRIVAAIPRLPREVATVLVYTAIVGALVFIILTVAQALSSSISQFVASLPNIRANMPGHAYSRYVSVRSCEKVLGTLMPHSCGGANWHA